jgi:hypothetical protein
LKKDIHRFIEFSISPKRERMPSNEKLNKIKNIQVTDNKNAEIIFMTKVKLPQKENQEIINGNPH